MRWFVIDELMPGQSTRISERLDEMDMGSGIPGLFWLPLPEKLLSPLQKDHRQTCGPYVMALEIEDDSLRMELLVRARSRLRCDCVHYAPTALVTHMIDYLLQLLTELQIET